MLMEDVRERIVAFGKRIATEGLAVGTSGNLSEYDPTTGLMAISPSGLGYFDTTPEDIVVLRLDGTVVEGTRRPSSEAPLHVEVYRRRPAARAVVHTHSPYATTLAALAEPIRAVHFTIADSGAEEVPLSPYATFGTPELAASVGKAFGEHPETSAVLMESHGLVACGPNMAAAFGLAVNLEFVSRIQWQAECAGTPRVLSGEEVMGVAKRFEVYGQPADGKE
ncbi:class II aldolase/adducin family protein [Olsenella sp. Marseille-P4559]|uniref:class II aldolase/adducin family protein n=1 Tax=Olsenella sp. Marseille-P4559 TaxID=2364795 RepID=UPI001031B54F|nr:class II aldolase/adducin family protein [Olsenella sp. Marseille-P4559]